MGFIATQVKSVLSKALVRYAGELKLQPKDVQIMIGSSDEEGTPIYKLLHNFKPIRDLTFRQILNVKVDMLGREMLATPVLQKSLVQAASENDASVKNIRYIILTQSTEMDEKKVKLIPFIYNGSKHVKKVTVEYIVNEDESELEAMGN